MEPAPGDARKSDIQLPMAIIAGTFEADSGPSNLPPGNSNGMLPITNAADNGEASIGALQASAAAIIVKLGKFYRFFDLC